MNTLVIGRVRGNMWYVGDGVTGHDATPGVFPGSGVAKAYVNDLYLHLEPDNADNGHIYTCTQKGDKDTAKWAYAGSILGPQPDLYDGLDSTSMTVAATANAARKLKKLIDDAGIYPMEMEIENDQTAYTANVTIENISTEITLTDKDGNTGTYSYTASGQEETKTVSITVGTEIGFAQEGAVVVNVASSEAAIRNVVLTGTGGEICDITPDMWEEINNLSEEVKLGAIITIVSGGVTYTYRAAKISKKINGVLTKVFPETLSKAVWAEEENGDTVYDRLAILKALEGMIHDNHYYASINDEDGNVIVDDDNNEIAGDWRYQIM